MLTCSSQSQFSFPAICSRGKLVNGIFVRSIELTCRSKETNTSTLTTFVVCNKYGPPMSSANKPYQKLYFLDARELGETFSPGYLSFANLRTLSTRTTVKQNFKFNKQNVQVLGSVCYNNHIFLINSISLKKMPYIMPKLHRQNNV